MSDGMKTPEEVADALVQVVRFEDSIGPTPYCGWEVRLGGIIGVAYFTDNPADASASEKESGASAAAWRAWLVKVIRARDGDWLTLAMADAPPAGVEEAGQIRKHVNDPDSWVWGGGGGWSLDRESAESLLALIDHLQAQVAWLSGERQ